MAQITINWNQAQEMGDEFQRNQQQAVERFLSEKHEMTDGRDLLYWMEQTKKELSWLVENAQGISPNLKQAVFFGCNADEIYNIEPKHAEVEERETPNKVYKNVSIFYLKTNDYLLNGGPPEFQIVLTDEAQEISFCYPNEDTVYNGLEKCNEVSKAKMKAFFDNAEIELLRQ